jgi:LAGLIDADG endonuclease
VLDVSQVPQRIGHYLAGITDGEGSFNVSFRKRGDYAIPWKVSLCFNVSQRDRIILTLFEQHLKCGTMRSRADGVWYYEVNNFTAIVENVTRSLTGSASCPRRSNATLRSSSKSRR